MPPQFDSEETFFAALDSGALADGCTAGCKPVPFHRFSRASKDADFSSPADDSENDPGELDDL